MRKIDTLTRSYQQSQFYYKKRAGSKQLPYSLFYIQRKTTPFERFFFWESGLRPLSQYIFSLGRALYIMSVLASIVSQYPWCNGYGWKFLTKRLRIRICTCDNFFKILNRLFSKSVRFFLSILKHKIIILCIGHIMASYTKVWNYYLMNWSIWC